ncbi:unnamed protein product [Candidula unifasciata]|uniref:Heparan-sulfate 6-O-sulfotransferase n=1 Tax=Candidula unifasciata TaxID=100452 RepID=A0A8S3Z2G6_9EUPU|nr:unnamed protein product [Candidula unifasciata]
MNRIFKIRFRKKTCSSRRYFRGIFVCLVVASSILILIFLFALHIRKPAVFTLYTCLGSENPAAGLSVSNYEAFLQGHLCKHNFNDSVLNKHRLLDLEGDDVLIYLHIQKTGGGSFGRHLVHNLDVKFPCKCLPGIKKCDCLTKARRHWLFSRHATGWMCGLHADWTELADCIDVWFQHNDAKSRKHRIYHYLTFLRNPVHRFLSEWQHVHRGATWKAARLHCNGKGASLDEVPFCFSGVNWSGVSLDEFLSCKHNLAFNRMTRMLANLSKVNCYNHTGLSQEQVDQILLQSAKENLLDFAFFGILEEQRKTQFLFENNLGIKFITDFQQKDETHASHVEISDEMMQRVLEKNRVDIELYQYAKDLFLQRVVYTEKRLGQTVQEYFNHAQDALENSGADNKNVRKIQHEDEYDNEEEYVEEVNVYPGKGNIQAIR